ncbi:MAG: carbon storage regulator [Pseudomonas sp.]|uniref:carbon storage regulator n=1 Tax=Pseudomonas sp. TaxID=306 RepID=UPI003D0B2F87
MGLVLERRPGQAVHIIFDENMSAAEFDELLRNGITVTLTKINDTRSRAKIGFEAPGSITILREELLERRRNSL